jgi:hypothetical protein
MAESFALLKSVNILTWGGDYIYQGNSVTVNISCTLLMTTTVDRKIKFEVEGLGKHLISIKLIGELSTKLDPNDIITVLPPIGNALLLSVSKRHSMMESTID